METKKTKKLSVVKKNISSQVLAKINILQESGEMRLPKDYSAENALKSAYLVLVETKNKQGQYALEHCTQESIANALLKMVVLGLSVFKKQVNLIMYADKLSCDLEYAGTILLAKRYGKLKEINAVTIYGADEFEFEIDIKTGRKKIIKHIQTLESLGGGKDKIKGAYAVMEFNDGSFDAEIMSIVQIEKSWMQGGAKGKSGAHINFTDQMCEKTVINRACKLLIRGSDDNVLFYPGSDVKKDVVKADMEHNIKENANKEEIAIEETEIIEVEAETVEVKPIKVDPLKIGDTVEIEGTVITREKGENNKIFADRINKIVGRKIAVFENEGSIGGDYKSVPGEDSADKDGQHTIKGPNF